jgi:hypothetical protein
MMKHLNLANYWKVLEETPWPAIAVFLLLIGIQIWVGMKKLPPEASKPL